MLYGSTPLCPHLAQDCRSTGGKGSTKTTHQGERRVRDLSRACGTTQLSYSFNNMEHSVQMRLREIATMRIHRHPPFMPKLTILNKTPAFSLRTKTEIL
jgi:hypothetical protein